MAFRANTVFLFGIFAIFGLAFAASCTEQAYLDSCAECSFNDYGMMDEECRRNHEYSGRACLIMKSPKIGYYYVDPNKCEGLSTCLDGFNSCKATYGTGTDEGDCQSSQMQQCFREADSCIYYELYKCNKESGPCVVIFAIAGVLAFALFARRN